VGAVSEWARNEITVIGEAATMSPDLVVHKVAAFINVSREAMDDSPALRVFVHDRLARAIRRKTHPWEFADAPAMPHLALFGPRLERLLAWLDGRCT